MIHGPIHIRSASKCWQLLAHQHGITSQITTIFVVSHISRFTTSLELCTKRTCRHIQQLSRQHSKLCLRQGRLAQRRQVCSRGWHCRAFRKRPLSVHTSWIFWSRHWSLFHPHCSTPKHQVWVQCKFVCWINHKEPISCKINNPSQLPFCMVTDITSNIHNHAWN